MRSAELVVPLCLFTDFSKMSRSTPIRVSLPRDILEKASSMRILQVHNTYRPRWGGEDTVVDLEANLLRRNGHEVARLSAWTGELERASPLRLIAAGFGTV